MSPRFRTLPRGLFDRQVAEYDLSDPAEFAEYIKSMPLNATERLEGNLKFMRRVACAVLERANISVDDAVPRELAGCEALAAEVLDYIRFTESSREQGDLDGTAVAMALATQWFTELRGTLMYERAVRSREKSLAHFPNKLTVSDEQILDAVHNNPTIDMAAAELGLGRSQVFARLRKIKSKL